MSDLYDVLIIGGGAAGTMAALRAALFNLTTCLVGGNMEARSRSRAQWVPGVDDVPGLLGIRYPITTRMGESLDLLGGFPETAAKLTRLKESIECLEQRADGFSAGWTPRRRKKICGAPKTLRARYVLLATGIMDVQPRIQGSIEPIFPYANARQALYSLDADGHRVIGQPTVVIGNSEDAAKSALLLHERYAPPSLTLITHQGPFLGREETKRRLECSGIALIESEILGFEGKARSTGLQAILLQNHRIECTRVVVALGFMVHNDLAKQLGVGLDDQGFVLCTAQGETSIPGVFVAGDLCAGRRKGIVTAWESALTAVETIEKRIREHHRPEVS